MYCHLIKTSSWSQTQFNLKAVKNVNNLYLNIKQYLKIITMSVHYCAKAFVTLKHCVNTLIVVDKKISCLVLCKKHRAPAINF